MFLLLAAGCANTNANAAPIKEIGSKSDPIELTVFAAASMTETLSEIQAIYKAVAPEVTLTFNFDSSGTLKTQIEEGADCDLFISAAQKQMNALDISHEKNTNKLDFILPESRVDLLENKVVLVVPEGNPAGIQSFEDVNTDAVSMIALGNADVPVGQYSEEIFTKMGIWDEIHGKITFGSNVKEVTTQVSEGAVDCGVVYATDAFSAGLTPVAEAPADMLATPVVYPAAVLKSSKHPEAAQAFLDYLRTDACTTVFEKVGFTINQ
ncbi:MAG TPA: molybdate ABC transporter substrate-binding protein [Peptococcaceae bacterium]|nr:molybdate ABC transporter substrate-binding protein [Peptococcaceae bacterium]